MAGDGVSLPSTIAQMGNVAKAQAKAQQPAQQVTPFSEQLGNKDELKVQRVREMQEAEQQKIKDEDQGKDHRQRRKLKRNRKRFSQDGIDSDQQDELMEADGSDGDSSEEQERLGALIDLRV